MARPTKSSGSQDFINRISDTISEHPRVSAAAAFQMGVLLGQAMQNAGALKGIGQKMAAAPAALASSIPTFGLFDPGKARSGRRKSHRQSVHASARKVEAKRSKRAKPA